MSTTNTWQPQAKPALPRHSSSSVPGLIDDCVDRAGDFAQDSQVVIVRLISEDETHDAYLRSLISQLLDENPILQSTVTADDEGFYVVVQFGKKEPA